MGGEVCVWGNRMLSVRGEMLMVRPRRPSRSGGTDMHLHECQDSRGRGACMGKVWGGVWGL